MIAKIDRWQRGDVDTNDEHFELLVATAKDGAQPEYEVVALVGPPKKGCINLSLLIEANEANASVIESVERQLKVYFFELREPDPWKYAQYHCGTSSNLYSSVQWSYIEARKVSEGRKFTELELDHFFWNEISTNQQFQSWFLQHTKFKDRALELDTNEKWHQRWYRDPSTKQESEGDILLFFKDRENAQRYTIHIENKPAHGKWQPQQPENYEKRATYCKTKWGYDEFQTVLIAPSSFIQRWPQEVACFHTAISYEDVAQFVPEFGISAIAALPS